MIGLPKSEKWVGQKKMGGIGKGGKVERKAKLDGVLGRDV